MDVKQIAPNHADHISHYTEKFLKNMFANESCIAQPKYDGERMLIHIDGDNVYCTSRRFSKKTGRYMENQEKLPILKEVIGDKFKDIGYTVLDCECYDKDWSTIVGILHSLPERAVELQKTSNVRFAVFDCLFFNNIDLREKPYYARLNLASDVVKRIEYDNLHLVRFMSDNFKSMALSDVTEVPHRLQDGEHELLMNAAIAEGFEGIVVKSLDRKYYDQGASLKCKKFETLDVIVCGYQKGRGKYADTIGALEIGYYDKDSDTIIKISKVNCGTDKERRLWYDNWSKMLNSVIEVKCQEVTEKSLRHPVYIRRRDDKDYKMCTKDTIFKA